MRYLFNKEVYEKQYKRCSWVWIKCQGHKKDKSNILILFSVTEQPENLRTYNGYQMINSGLDSVRTPSDVTITQIDAATLIINLLDAKSGCLAGDMRSRNFKTWYGQWFDESQGRCFHAFLIREKQD